MNSTPDHSAKRLLSHPRRNWIIILLLLLLIEVTCLSFTSVDELFAKTTAEAVLPVSLHPAKRADYSVDPGDYLNPNINLSILIDILAELELDEASLNARLATVTAMLAQPIPSATPPASTQEVQPQVTASGTPTASSTPLPSPSLITSATASQTAQTATTTALATSTKTITQPAITSTTASRTATATRKPTRTVTRTSTQVAPATSTLTLTPLPGATRTPTRTATTPSTPTQTQTPAPGWTHTPTPTATASHTPTLTRTATITSTPTNTPSATGTATVTSTSTPTPTVTSTYTSTPTGTQTSTITPTSTQTSTSTSTSTATQTSTITPTSTQTSTSTSTSTATQTSTITPTPTGTSTSTSTPTETQTPTPTDEDCYPYPVDGFVPSQDTWINKNAPGQSYESDVQLHIRPVNTADRRALIQFDLTSIPIGSTILSAVLYLNDETGEEYTVFIYPIEEAWPESVTWETAPAFGLTAIGSFNLTLNPCVRAAWLDVDQVSGWVDNPATNFGLLLYATGNAGEDLITSQEGALPPKLVVDYQPPRGEAKEIHRIQTTIAKAYPPIPAAHEPVPPGAALPLQPGNPMRRR